MRSLKSVLKVSEQETTAVDSDCRNEDSAPSPTRPPAPGRIETFRSADDQLYADAALETPSPPVWREQRLRGIGSALSDSYIHADETTGLNTSQSHLAYGAADSTTGVSWRSRRPSLSPILTTLRGHTWGTSQQGLSSLVSPGRRSFPAYFKTLRRKPSAYDSSIAKDLQDDDDHRAEKINGIRVWYSSFQSIDWLHDAIKDVARLRRLRRRKSLRGRIANISDRFSGWFVVSIVGFLTAVAAFMIVRSERWLFDLKEGHCKKGFFKSFSVCCPGSEHGEGVVSAFLGGNTCPEWETWDHLILPDVTGGDALIESWVVEYMTYTAMAILLAFVSSLLTISLTSSSSFITHKDSGIFNSADDSTKSSVAPKRVMYYAAGSGIPEIKTILSGFVIHGYLGGRTLFTKSVGLALSVASGLSLGKEGPMVHIASCIGNIVSRFFEKYENNEGKRREILSAACAAGVAVAFGAPIGGVLFSLEEVSYFFPPKVMWRSFFGAMIATMTLKFLDPLGTGKLVLFQVTYDKDWHAFELFLFILIGVFGGVYGAYFSKLNYRWSKHVRNGTWLKKYPILEVVLVTFVTALLSYLNQYTRMGGTELVYNLLSECKAGDSHGGLCVHPNNVTSVIQAITVALVVKGALTIITFGIKVPAGIFIPTLGVGACFGRIVGLIVDHLQWRYPGTALFSACGGQSGCIVPGIYAMVGAAATLSGVTRTTVSLAVIMFELTDTLTYTVPVMLAILVAKTVADSLEPKGIYDLVIDLGQLPYLDAKHQHLWGGLQLDDAVDRNVEVIRADHTNSVALLSDQLQRALSTGINDDGFPVLREFDQELRLVGYIGLNELEHALSRAADNASGIVHFRSVDQSRTLNRSGSISSSIFDESSFRSDPLDFTVFMDQAPLTVQINSPLELVQQMFVKLGARYVVVTRSDGSYVGLLSKKTWLEFLSDVQS